MSIDVALRLKRMSAWGPWLLTVLLAAGWCARVLRVPATSPSMTKDAERAKRVERWPRRRSGVWGLVGFGGARAGRLQAPRPRQRPAAWGGRRPPGPEPGQLIATLNRRMRLMGVALALTVPSGAVCGRLVLTLSAPAAGTAAPRLPGTLLAGFIPAEVWRNSGRG